MVNWLTVTDTRGGCETQTKGLEYEVKGRKDKEEEEKKKEQQGWSCCCFDTFALKVSRDWVFAISWGRSFHSLTLLGKNEFSLL